MPHPDPRPRHWQHLGCAEILFVAFLIVGMLALAGYAVVTRIEDDPCPMRPNFDGPADEVEWQEEC